MIKKHLILLLNRKNKNIKVKKHQRLIFPVLKHQMLS